MKSNVFVSMTTVDDFFSQTIFQNVPTVLSKGPKSKKGPFRILGVPFFKVL